jgi:hypothetical protein
MHGCGRSVPAPGSDEYRELVGSFYVGVAAMETGVDARALEEFTRVTEVIPGEAAAWANLALIHMRRNEVPAASDYLAKALISAPGNGHVLRLSGRLAALEGRAEDALDAFRKATDVEPVDIRAGYAAAQVLDRDLGRPADALEVLRGLVGRAPDNLAAYVELLRLAAASGQADVLRQALLSDPLALEEWPQAARDQFLAIGESLEAEGTSAAATRIAFLRNLLVRTPRYRSDILAVQPRVEDIDELMQRPVVLEAPAQRPSIADEDLRFTVATGSVVRGPNEFVVATLVVDELAPAAVVVRGDSALVEGAGTIAFPRGGPVAPPVRPVARADFNYDFTVDLALAGSGGFRMYFQDSARVFHDRTQSLGLTRDVLTASYSGLWPVDLDLEGDLDIVIGRTSGPPIVLRNRGDETFESVSLFGSVDGLRGWVWADFDADGDPDAGILDAGGSVHVFSNERSGRYAQVSTWPGGDDPVLGISVADVDGDAVPELIGARRSGISILGSEPDGRSLTTALPVGTGAAPGDLQLFLRDLDNNGGLDLLASWPTTTAIFLQRPDGSFGRLRDAIDARVLDIEDVDGDGRLDLFALDPAGQAVRLQNAGTLEYHWKEIRPRAATALGDQRINSLALGGQIELRAGLLFQKRFVEGPTVHFGLGEHSIADVARIIWPNGDVQVEFDLLSGQLLLAQQRLKGSCPWLFTYDGTGMRFVTDFIWRSPLGMRINAQETAGIATTEDWVLIPGEALVPRNGVYDIRITAELWETHFFDHVALMAVDHPSGTHAFVDERLSVPPPPFDVHITAALKEPLRASDHNGQDVLSLVTARDETYLGSFRRGAYQGVAEHHFVELELGSDVFRAADPVLIASGWIRPTDSSINVALGQGTADPPMGLQLEVLARDGSWVVADDQLGFPAGKEKTVVLSLRNAVDQGSSPLRIRLRTNLEIYWDLLAWSNRVSDAASTIMKQLPITASLAYRGFSEVAARDRSSPELPDYAALQGTVPVWQDLVGYYTRYGGVAELLVTVDDRYVIMNAGDELRLEFAVGESVAQGMTRDFVLVGDGWVKDGDFNTAASETVLPLPRHSDPSYSDTPTALETDPAYLQNPEDWIRYHTRYVSNERFRRALLPD